MILLGNTEAGSGVSTVLKLYREGASVLDALVAGVACVEEDPAVHTVGYGGHPNVAGVMECDAAVMDGASRNVGAVAGVQDTLHVGRLALEVMRHSPHVMLVGEGARLFADEMGLPRKDMLNSRSREIYEARFSGEENCDLLAQAAFSKVSKAPKIEALQRDTTVMLGIDQAGDLGVVTSTSGWAWKYPGRAGDAPVPGCGFYADNRYGAAACTHTGEMTMRSVTSYQVVAGLRAGLDLEDAVGAALADLKDLTGGTLGPVVVHAINAHGEFHVAQIGEDKADFWVWKDGMDTAEKRPAS